MFGLTAGELLGLSVFAAVVSVLGNLAATLLKDFVLSRSLERWKEERAARRVYRRYKAPILLSGIELAFRLGTINDEWPKAFLSSSVLAVQADCLKENLTTDPYYQKYQLVSTTYRLAAFLGWLELYRQDLTYLELDLSNAHQVLDACLNNLREDLADGRLNTDPEWLDWTDRMIFREEQRAIGEAMIVDGQPRSIRGYASFNKLLDDPDGEGKWIRLALAFLVDMGSKDFRKIRFAKLEKDVLELLTLLDDGKMPAALQRRRDQLRSRSGA